MTDITALGELLIDFTETGRSPNGQRLFEQNPGGAPANVLACAAKLGLDTAFLGKVGADMHGRFLQDVLEQHGVHTEGLCFSDDAFTTLAFVSLHEGEREFSFARKPGADTQLQISDLNENLLCNTRVFHFGSLSLTDEPARSTTLYAMKRAKASGAIISYDPNYRASLWPNEKLAKEQMRSVLPYVDIMKLSDEETGLLTDVPDPHGAADILLLQGVQVVVVTLGSNGALVCFGENKIHVHGHAVDVVDTTGAGDAFWGGFLYQLLKEGLAPEHLTADAALRCAKMGNAVAACCIQKRGGISAMPDAALVAAYL